MQIVRWVRLAVAATVVVAAGCGETTTAPASAVTVVRYRATLQATWNGATHPLDVPGNPHFSPLVGGTHTRDMVFWREGDLATAGIQNMAERGVTATLVQEIQAAVGRGTARGSFIGPGQFASPGSSSVEFDVDRAFPLVTLVSMIAPSPDWFVGVAGVSLYANGAWANDVTVDLIPWDAGSDGGTTFEAPDLPLSPHVPIARIVTAPLSPGGRVTPLGRLVVVRLQ